MVHILITFYLISAFTNTLAFPNEYHRSATRFPRTLSAMVAQQGLPNSDTSEHPSKIIQGNKNERNDKIDWTIRPATIDDRDGCAALIQLSYRTLLPRDYSDECLANCLPLITTPREQLLTCNTWFVVEHPSTRQIVGCGGWTLRSPLASTNKQNKVDNDEAATQNTDLVESTPSLIDPNEPVPHLRHFATHPDYSRMGIASTIWKTIHSEVSKQFLAQGKPFPAMEVFGTLTAEGFYASCGFKVVSRFDMTLGKDAVFPVILMRRGATL